MWRYNLRRTDVVAGICEYGYEYTSSIREEKFLDYSR